MLWKILKTKFTLKENKNKVAVLDMVRKNVCLTSFRNGCLVLKKNQFHEAYRKNSTYIRKYMTPVSDICSQILDKITSKTHLNLHHLKLHHVNMQTIWQMT